MPAATLKVFISSPGDVGQERLLAARVVERLQGEFAALVELALIRWEHEPVLATSTFQDQIVPPSETDIVVCILWSRLGTRLPENYRHEDGTPVPDEELVGHIRRVLAGPLKSWKLVSGAAMPWWPRSVRAERVSSAITTSVNV